MRILPLNKYLVVIGFGLLGSVSGLVAGPEQIADTSKDGKDSKDLPIVQTMMPCDPRWYISLGGGAEMDFGNTTVIQPATKSGVAPATSEQIHRGTFQDIYHTGWAGQAEVGYALTQHLEIFGNFRYAHANASDRVDDSRFVCNFRPFGGPLIILPISFALDDYDSYGGDLGLRWFLLNRQARFCPYLAVSGGATDVQSIGLDIYSDQRQAGGGADELVFQGKYLRESWVGTGSAVLGLEFNLTCHLTLGVNAGVSYASTVADSDQAFDERTIRIGGKKAPAAFLGPINDNVGDRWTVPTAGYVKIRF